MIFQYDNRKSMANREKHGVDFKEAQQIWQNQCVEFVAKSEYEDRFAAIGYIRDKLYTCIFCLRNGENRIISCRRARKGEVNLYEANCKT